MHGTLRVIFFNQQSTDLDALAAETEVVADRLRAMHPAADVSVTNAYTDYQNEARRAGGWVQWAQSVTARYDLLVAPAPTCGRSTADVIGHALAIGKPVFRLAEGGGLYRVRAVGPLQQKVVSWAELTCDEHPLP